MLSCCDCRKDHHRDDLSNERLGIVGNVMSNKRSKCGCGELLLFSPLVLIIIQESSSLLTLEGRWWWTGSCRADPPKPRGYSGGLSSDKGRELTRLQGGRAGGG